MPPSASTCTTFLRIKRPRTVDPITSLQFAKTKRARHSSHESVGEIVDQLESSNLSSDFSNEINTLTWKRIETSVAATHNTGKPRQKRFLKYVDASLDHIDAKRPKLALTLQKPDKAASSASVASLSPSSKSRRKHKVLDPTSRLIDQKMRQIQDGSSTLQQYLDFLENDERVMHDTKKYLSWTLPDGSNVLHLAAMWNNVEEARYILMNYPKALTIDALDTSGHRPYQYAVLAGNDQMAQLFLAFGADAVDYVYDVFELVTARKEEMENPPTCVELRGGVGYLDENGELILETQCPEDYVNDSDDDFGNLGDDVDSNAEDYEFNDYPEEPSEDEMEDYDSDRDVGFRHERIHMPLGSMGLSHTKFHQDESDAEFDAQYGLYDGHDEGNTQRRYAYDPNYDER